MHKKDLSEMRQHCTALCQNAQQVGGNEFVELFVHFKAQLQKVYLNPTLYRVGMVVGYRVGLTLYFDIPLSAQSCLGRWKFCRIGWSVGQYG